MVSGPPGLAGSSVWQIAVGGISDLPQHLLKEGSGFEGKRAQSVCVEPVDGGGKSPAQMCPEEAARSLVVLCNHSKLLKDRQS